jgi:hypothetical protein
MAKVVPGTDPIVKSDGPLLDVEATAVAPLTPGKHVFQLVVRNDSPPATPSSCWIRSCRRACTGWSLSSKEARASPLRRPC